MKYNIVGDSRKCLSQSWANPKNTRVDSGMLALSELAVRTEKKCSSSRAVVSFYVGFKVNCPKASSIPFNYKRKYLVSIATRKTRREKKFFNLLRCRTRLYNNTAAWIFNLLQKRYFSISGHCVQFQNKVDQSLFPKVLEFFWDESTVQFCSHSFEAPSFTKYVFM